MRRLSVPASVAAAFLAIPSLTPAAVSAQNMFFLSDGDCAWGDRGDAVWASSIQGYSSQYDETQWSAARALGEPDVFPRYGDLAGAWAASSRDNVYDHIDVLFPHAVDAGELWVFETNGGGVYLVSAINPDGSTTVLGMEPPQRSAGISAASHIVVPVVPNRTIIGVRIATSSALANAYAEVDAVAAIPARPCTDNRSLAPEAAEIPTGAHVAVNALPGTTPPKVVWVSSVLEYGSQYNASGWAATQVVGAPDVFPNHGDLPGAWAPARPDQAVDALRVQFPRTQTREIWIYETFGVGGTWMVEGEADGTPRLIWASTPSPVSPDQARVLRIVLPEPRPIEALSIAISPRAVGAYTEIDAIGLVPDGGE